ncbi:MAG: Signal recognition particle receptor FtsY [Pseudomonadota bacterium]
MFDFFKKDKTATAAEAPEKVATASWTERLKQGLSRTRSQLGNQLAGLFGGGKIDDDVYEELETILLTSDVGVAATQALLEDIKGRVQRQSLSDTSQLKSALKDALMSLLAPLEQQLKNKILIAYFFILVCV